MAKFSFRLQNVLTIKRKFEDQQKNQFMQAKRMLNQEEEILHQMNQHRVIIYEIAKRNRKSALQVRQLLENQAQVKYIEEQIVTQQGEVERASKRVAKEQEILTRLMRERKTYEQLREREFEEYKLALQAEEVKEIDELTSYRYGQKEE